jgi:hypothetical protein
MKSGRIIRVWPGLPLCLIFLSGFQSMTPRDVVSRSLKAHGGDKLTNWKGMTIRGTVDMADGIVFRAAYLVFAEPGKLRIESDMTVTQGGRYFYEDFLNDEVAWSRRNLIPSRGNLEDMKKKMNQCYGIAFYANKADSLVQKDDTTVEWREKPDLQSNTYKVVASRPAYVISALIGKETTDLYIDKENFYFLQEASGKSKRVYWDFKKFGEVVLPTKILEIGPGSQGERITPYAYETVKFNVPIEEWLFTEDMPKSANSNKK